MEVCTQHAKEAATQKLRQAAEELVQVAKSLRTTPAGDLAMLLTVERLTSVVHVYFLATSSDIERTAYRLESDNLARQGSALPITDGEAVHRRTRVHAEALSLKEAVTKRDVAGVAFGVYRFRRFLLGLYEDASRADVIQNEAPAAAEQDDAAKLREEVRIAHDGLDMFEVPRKVGKYNLRIRGRLDAVLQRMKEQRTPNGIAAWEYIYVRCHREGYPLPGSMMSALEDETYNRGQTADESSRWPGWMLHVARWGLGDGTHSEKDCCLKLETCPAVTFQRRAAEAMARFGREAAKP